MCFPDTCQPTCDVFCETISGEKKGEEKEVTEGLLVGVRVSGPNTIGGAKKKNGG